jgi:uncharacterized protein YjbI with pentapeptide repeats
MSVRLNLTSVDLRRTPLAYANLVGAKLDRMDFRWIVSDALVEGHLSKC